MTAEQCVVCFKRWNCQPGSRLAEVIPLAAGVVVSPLVPRGRRCIFILHTKSMILKWSVQLQPK